MDDRRFDTLTRMIGQGASRRSVLKGLLGIGGTAVAGTAVAKGVEARTIGARPTVPTPTLPSCLLPKQMCGGDCCEPGKCKDGHCCPNTTDAWCGGECWPASLCTTTGGRCEVDERVCGAVCCAAAASCTRSGNTDTCCDPGEADQFPCGWECCASEELCCDRECCPAGHACLTRVAGGETGLIEEEMCCPTDLICDGICCLGGVCYDPNAGTGSDEDSAESSSGEEQPEDAELLCCPSASAICEGARQTLCCDAGTDCCVDDFGTPHCLNPNQCCRDTQCTGSGNPETCSAGACNLETHQCEAGATSCDTANFEQCCGSNICCRGSCCGDPPSCCDNLAGEICCDGRCTEVSTDENCSGCGDRCIGCEYCGLFDGLVQCGHDDNDPQNLDGETCGQCLLCSGGTCEFPDPVCSIACDIDADCTGPVELSNFPCYECSNGFCVTVDPPFAVLHPDLFGPIGYCCAVPGSGQLVYNASGFDGEGCCFDSHCGGANVCCNGHCAVPDTCAGTPEPTTTTADPSATTTTTPDPGEERTFVVNKRRGVGNNTLPLDGACFVLHEGDCPPSGSPLGPQCTANGTTTFVGLTWGQSYCLAETAAPPGYLPFSPISVSGSTPGFDLINSCGAAACPALSECIGDTWFQHVCTAETMCVRLQGQPCQPGTCDDLTGCGVPVTTTTTTTDPSVTTTSTTTTTADPSVTTTTPVPGEERTFVVNKRRGVGANTLPLDGACFVLHEGDCPPSGSPLGPQCTADGTTTFVGLTWGQNYCLAETAAPPGYLPFSPISVSGSTPGFDIINSCSATACPTLSHCDGNTWRRFACGADTMCVQLAGQACGTATCHPQLGCVAPATTTTQEATFGGETEIATEQLADPCVPETCASLSVSCGIHDDGCGGTVDCGACCTPRDYCNAGECGLVDDGCAGVVDCGECPVIDAATTTPPEPTTSAPQVACLAERARCVDDSQCCQGLCRDRNCGTRGRRQCTTSC